MEMFPPFFGQKVRPVDPYGVSKLAAEHTLKILADTHNIEYNIAVPQTFGPVENVVSIMTNLILQNRRPIIYGILLQTRSFSDIDDCIYCLKII